MPSIEEVLEDKETLEILDSLETNVKTEDPDKVYKESYINWLRHVDHKTLNHEYHKSLLYPWYRYHKDWIVAEKKRRKHECTKC